MALQATVVTREITGNEGELPRVLDIVQFLVPTGERSQRRKLMRELARALDHGRDNELASVCLEFEVVGDRAQGE